jgi:pyrophosphatase PpaX
MYQLILFDLDGTVADTELVMVQTMLSFIDQYTPTKKTTLNELIKISGPPLVETLQAYFPKENPVELAKAFAIKARTFYPKFAVAFPGIKSLLQACEQLKIPVGIVTSKMRVNALFTLDVIGLKDAFPLVISLDDVKQPKPNPEGIQLALKHFKVEANKTLYVGDTTYDYFAGTAAGTDTALVTWGFKQFTKQIQPTMWIDHFDRLKELVYGRKI